MWPVFHKWDKFFHGPVVCPASCKGLHLSHNALHFVSNSVSSLLIRDIQSSTVEWTLLMKCFALCKMRCFMGNSVICRSSKNFPIVVSLNTSCSLLACRLHTVCLSDVLFFSSSILIFMVSYLIEKWLRLDFIGPAYTRLIECFGTTWTPAEGVILLP